MTTYEEVHTGAVVLGHDGDLWGVEHIEREPQLAVTLVKNGQRVTGYPPAGTPITVVKPADIEAERQAADVLLAAGFDVGIVREHWGE